MGPNDGASKGLITGSFRERQDKTGSRLNPKLVQNLKSDMRPINSSPFFSANELAISV